MMGGFGGGGMFIGGLLMIAFWVLVIGGGVWLVVTLARGSQNTPGAQVTSQTPLDILEARYAKGEISKEQFEQMKRDLA